MSNRDLAIAVVALLTPAVTALIANMGWSPGIKLGAFLAVCAVASLALLWGYDTLDTADYPRLLILLILVGGVVYRLYKAGLDHVGVASDRMMNRAPAVNVSPPAVDIKAGTVANVTDAGVTQTNRTD